MPSRTRSEVRGVVDHSALGADEVDAIADGRERPLPDKAQARMRRNSVSGAVEATEWKSDAIALNEDLHKN